MRKGRHLLLKHWEIVIQKQPALFSYWVEGCFFMGFGFVFVFFPFLFFLWTLWSNEVLALAVADCIRYHLSKVTPQSSKILNQQPEMPSSEFSLKKLSKIPLHTKKKRSCNN